MFAKLFSSAKSLLSHSPSVPEKDIDQLEDDRHNNTDDMVTLRSGTQAVETPRKTAARKAKRGLGDEESSGSNSSKRRRQGKQEEEEGKEIRVEVVKSDVDTPTPTVIVPATEAPEVTITKATNESTENETKKLEIRTRAISPLVVVPKDTDTIAQSSPARDNFFTPESHRASSVYATPATTLRKMYTPSAQIAREAAFADAETPLAAEDSEKKGRKRGKRKITKKVVVELPSSVEEEDDDDMTPRPSQVPAQAPEEISHSAAESETTATMSAQEADNEGTPVPPKSVQSEEQAEKPADPEENTPQQNAVQETESSKVPQANAQVDGTNESQQVANGDIQNESSTAQVDTTSASIKPSEEKSTSSPANAERPRKRLRKSQGTAVEIYQPSPKPVPQPEKSHIRFADEDTVITHPTGMLNGERVRFGPAKPSDEASTKPSNADTEMKDQAEYQDSDSDSDEAPETITVASAISKAKKAEQEAARALLAAANKEKQKRKERAERVAEEQKAKKKREAKAAKKLAKQMAREKEDEDEDMDDAEDQEMVDSEEKLDINNLPTLLPTSLLASAPEKRPAALPTTALIPGKSAAVLAKEKLNRHIKFAEHGEKQVKDKKKGPVSVRVLEKGNPVLPPKVNKDTRNIREKWLRGRREEKVDKRGRRIWSGEKVRRKEVNRGFLRNGRDE